MCEHLTLEEFAAQTGQTKSTLATYIGRKKVVVTERKTKNGKERFVDTTKEVNRAFIEKHAWQEPVKMPEKQKGGIKISLGEPDTSEWEEENDNAEEGEGKIEAIPISQKKLLHWQAVKTQRGAEELKIKIEKAKGMLIPAELFKPVLLQHDQHIMMEQKNADEEMLTMFAHKYGISGPDVAYIRGEWVKKRNAAATKATEASIMGVAGIVNEYAEKRGVGQRR